MEDKLEELANDEKFRQRLSDAYYDGRVGDDTVEAILGHEDAFDGMLRSYDPATDVDAPVPGGALCHRG